MTIRGHVGARRIIRRNPQYVLTVEDEDNRCFLDIDEEKDIQKNLIHLNRHVAQGLEFAK